jgi:hypothetical protein
MTLLRHLPRFREAYRTLDQLARREEWSRAETEEHQLRRVKAPSR